MLLLKMKYSQIRGRLNTVGVQIGWNTVDLCDVMFGVALLADRVPEEKRHQCHS